METICSISGLYRNELGDELFEALAAIYPDGMVYPNYPGGRKGPQAVLLKVNLPIEHPVTQNIFRLAEENGLEPANAVSPGDPSKKHFNLCIVREYDVNDYRQAHYLIPQPQVHFEAGTSLDGKVELALITGTEDEPDYDRQTGIIIRPQDFYQEPLIGANWGMVVTDTVKKQMEQAGLRRLLFRKCQIGRPRPPKANLPETYWSLTSDLILPPVSPVYVVQDDRGQPWDGDTSKPYYFFEGTTFPESFYDKFEWHYPAGALASVEPFDIALTYEQMAGTHWHHLVCSQRFYQFCTEAKLKLQWQPVRIDN